MPKVDTTVGKLVTMIADGELRLPAMQRRYVWPATRVRDLLDSLYRDYPSGTILVWETDREMPSRDLAVGQGGSPFKGHKLLLDGQQRLTSLSAILRGEPVTVRGKRRPIEILFNLDHPNEPEFAEVEGDTEPDDGDGDDDEGDDDTNVIQERLKQKTFVVASGSLAADPRWVKVSSVFRDDASDAQILKGLVKSFDDPNFDRYSKRLQALRKIRDYPYVMHVLDKALSYEEVADIFVRVNSLGMKLRGSDLALAQITSRWTDSLKLFEEFQEQCDNETWFTLDLGLIVRALVAFTTNQSRFKTAGTIPVERLKEGWVEAKKGLEFAVNFMRANARIEDESLLSSPLFLIAVGAFGRKHDYKLTANEEADLLRWLYVGNARGHYRASSETTLDADLSLISKEGKASALLDALKQQFGRLEILPQDFAGRTHRSALYATAYLALQAAGARDWHSRLGLSLTHAGKLHYVESHHIFPKALLQKAGYDRTETNEIANLAFIGGGTNRKIAAKPPEEYLAKTLQEQGREALELHCVPADPALWKVEAYPRFLEFRRDALAKAVNEFINRHVNKDAPTVAEIIARGEDDTTEFKSSARWDYKENKANKVLEGVIVKTIASFLNTQGGTLLIGVADNGQILGLEPDFRTLGKRADRDGYQQFLTGLISTSLGPEVCASLQITFHPVEGKDVCVVQVKESPRPVYLEEDGKEQLWIRAGNTTRVLDARGAVEYCSSRWR